MDKLPQKDIIIKCSLKEMVKCFFKDYAIIWHDPDLNSQENQQYMVQLEKFCKIRTFTEWEKAAICIRETKRTCHVITSGTNGELLVREISSHQNVNSIYVFCLNEDFHTAWTKNEKKIACVKSEIGDISNTIEQKLLEWYKQERSLKRNLPAFQPLFNDVHKSTMNHLHRYLKVIPKFKNREQAKNDFLCLSREIYSDTKNIALMMDFEKDYNDYNKESILKWYTQESFLYKMTNNCLRIATSDSIQYSRLPLSDLQRAIKEQYQTKSKDFHGLLYRAACLSEEEWSNLKENMGREIEMHGFLSASKEKNTALTYLEIDSNEKVLITIIVPKGPNEEEQGFAEVEGFSKYPQEKEVLFNVRSRFTVLETEEKYSEEIASRHLVLLYGAQGFRKFIAEKTPAQEVKIPENISCSCCKILGSEADGKVMFTPIKSRENNLNDCYCKKCILNFTDSSSTPLLYFPLMNDPPSPFKMTIKGFEMMNPASKIPFYGYKCSQCKAIKEKAYFTCIDCEKIFCHSCFENPADCFGRNHVIVFESFPFSFWSKTMSENELGHLKFHNDFWLDNDLFRQARMYFESDEFEKAIQYCKTYLDQNETPCQDSKFASCYANMGIIFYNMGEYQKALENHFKALEIQEKIYEENNSNVAKSYNNIGIAYHKQNGQPQKALEYLFKALDIEKFIYGENDPQIARSYSNIGGVYRDLGKHEEALEYFLKALDIQKLVLKENHPNIARSYQNIGSIYMFQLECKEAFECYLKALDINRNIFGENHSDIASCYNHLALLSSMQGKNDEAMIFRLKCLNVNKLVYGEKHCETASSYHNAGIAYEQQKDYKKALEYYLKALELRKLIYEENHLQTGYSYMKIGMIYSHQREYQNALESSLKALEIFNFQKDDSRIIKIREDISSRINQILNDISSISSDMESTQQDL